MRTVQRIEDLDGPAVIGRMYDVPAVLLNRPQRWFPDRIVPVNGGLHEDRDLIGFPDNHWHTDYRFVRKCTMQRIARDAKFRGDSPEVRMAGRVTVQKYVEKEIRIRRTCRYEPLAFPSHYRPSASMNLTLDPDAPVPIEFIVRLEKHYRDAVVKCGVCPHRGLSLAGVPVVDGKRVCPGHGLRWDVETGKLAPRLIAVDATLSTQV